MGNGELISIYELVHLIAKVMDFSGRIIFKGSDASVRNSSKYADLSMFQALYPKFQFTTLEEGLRETVQWYRVKANALENQNKSVILN